MLNYQTHEISQGHEWVVFFHGIGGSHNIFYKQIDEYKKNFNLLLIDFPGHGESLSINGPYSFELMAKLTFEIMDHLQIRSAHFVGISMGTIIMHEACRISPQRIKSMILGGAALKWTKWGKCLVETAFAVRRFFPYMFLYHALGLIIMPKINHQKSRIIFSREAKKLGNEEFMKWAKIIKSLNKIYPKLKKKKNIVPKLYIMGREDHMFLETTIKETKHDPLSTVHIIEQCGHVCNIEKYEEFNSVSIDFIKKQNVEIKKEA